MVDGHSKYKGIVAIIQARMGSSRLPGKVLMKLPADGKRTLLDQIIERIPQQIKYIIATSNKSKDDELSLRYPNVFRGSENNVLERFYLAAKDKGFEHIVRLTADNPLIDPELMLESIDAHLKSGADYTCTEGLPLGTNFEIISWSALVKAQMNSNDPYEREHVSPYIRNNDDFKKYFHQFKGFGDFRLTIDYPSDYDMVERIFSELGNDVSLKEVNMYLIANPNVAGINQNNQQLS